MAASTAEQLVEQPNVILHDVSWETYERLLKEHGPHAGTRFTYDQGILQIMIIGLEHDRQNRLLASFVEALLEEWDMDFENAGSTTFKRKDIKRGFEPDSCFYIHHPEIIRSKKRINLAKDPPPDLIVEIDVTHGSLDRLPVFAAVGILEVWRYEHGLAKIYRLSRDEYVESEESGLLPGVTAKVITQFVAESQSMRRVEWLGKVREWARSHNLQQQNTTHSET